MKRALLLPLLALAAGCHNLTVDRSPGDNPSPADIKIVHSRLAHTNAAERNTAVRILENWFADLAVPFPADDPALPADLEAAAEARAAEPAPSLPGGDGDDASTLRLLAAMMRTQGPRPERPFAVLTNDIGRLDCWKRLFLLDGDDSALRRVQELLGVRYDGRDASRADPAAIRSRWLLAPAVDSGGGTPVRPCHLFPGGKWCRWHAAVGPRLDRLVPREWGGCVLPDPKNLRSPAATLAGGAAAPVRLDELPAYGGALDWEALSFLEDESVLHPEFALRPDPATPGGVILSAAQAYADDHDYVEYSGPRFPATNIVLRDEVPLRPGQTALFGVRGTRTTHQTDRTPILSDIPLLGRLFTTETTTTNAVETVLLVRYTPRHAKDAEGKFHAESAENAAPVPHAAPAESAKEPAP